MSSYNSATIIGRLGDDPQVNETQGGVKVANLSVATSEKYKNKQGELVENTTWLKVVLWDRLAEIAEEYLSKGSLVHVTGPIQNRSYEDKEGVTKYITEIKGLNLTMLDSKKDSSGGNSGSAPATAPKPEPAVDLDDVDGDLPF